MRLFVSTGDVSGDKHVSKVIKELRVLVKELDVYGIGGDELIKEGARIYCHLDELSVVGVS